MKLGVSTYCFVEYLRTGRMSVLDIFDWAVDHGAEHVEIVPIGFTLTGQPDLVEEIVRKSRETGVEISNYAIAGDFLKPDEASLEEEYRRIESEVDIAHHLGVKRMRHDIAWRPAHECTIVQFEADFPRFVQGCQRIADYAAQYGITTSIENHGYLVQGSDRVLRVVHAVNRANFRTTVDTGNFCVIDEEPTISVPKALAYASMVHLKDNYLRDPSCQPGQGWGRTVGGRYFRGAIFGHGDIRVERIIQALKTSGYNGYVSIEFEGMEDPGVGTTISLENARALIERVQV